MVGTDQIDRRMTWLDEQRRKDSEEIGRILERLEALDQALRSQNQQVQELAVELSRTSAFVAQVREFDERFIQHQLAVTDQVETVEQRLLAREDKLESIRKADSKQLDRGLSEIRRELKRQEEVQDWMETRKREEIRLKRAQDTLEEQVKELTAALEEIARPIAAVQEGRRQDGQRLGDLETRASGSEKKAASLRALIDNAEDQIAKVRTKVSEIESGEMELRQAQSLWTEQQAIKLAEFERLWKVREKQFEAFETRANELDQRMETYEQTYRELVSVRDELQEVIERLERRIGEVSELQRLGEERIAGEWSKFQGDHQKRWSGFRLNADELWKEHDRKHARMASDIQTLQADLEDTMVRLSDLGRLSRDRLEELMALTRDWASNSKESGAESE